MTRPYLFQPHDLVGVLHRGFDTGKRGRVREIVGNGDFLVVDPEPLDENDSPYYDSADQFFLIGMTEG